MTQKVFEDYKNDFLAKVKEIKDFKYTSNGVGTLQQKFQNIVLPGHNKPSRQFEEIEEQITTAKRDFISVAGEAQYTYKSLPDSWHEGFEKTLKPGDKNAMLANIEFVLEMCLYYIQKMIYLKYVEERPQPADVHAMPHQAHIQTLLGRMQKLGS